MIHVIAAIQAREGKLDNLTTAFRTIVVSTRQKAGCIEYNLAAHLPSGLPGQAPFNCDELIIVEKWADLDALKEHIADPDYRAWFTGVWDWVASASMQIFDALD
jgi:quinol monooxygenase YgiN